MLCCLVIGVSKGIRTVYSGLIIPNYVPLDRLPCAFGLQNVSNGIFVLAFGPLLGNLETLIFYNFESVLVNPFHLRCYT